MELVDVQTANPFRALNTLGQSIWLDSISRHLIGSGELTHLIVGVVKAAQASGDLKVLIDRGRRVLPVHIGAAVREESTRSIEAVDSALM
jgi:hypothetical protein